jgi:hypothetical protein
VDGKHDLSVGWLGLNFESSVILRSVDCLEISLTRSSRLVGRIDWLVYCGINVINFHGMRSEKPLNFKK